MKVSLLDKREFCGVDLTMQAHALWALGFGAYLGFESEESYLESIPEPPEFPRDYYNHFDRKVLVETRVPLEEQLRLLRIEEGEQNVKYVNTVDRGGGTPEVYWMMAHAGNKHIKEQPARAEDGSYRAEYRGQLPEDCKKAFNTYHHGEVALTLMEALALIAQDRKPVQEREIVLDASRTIPQGIRGSDHCAGLRLRRGGIWLMCVHTLRKEFLRTSMSRGTFIG